MNSSHNMAFTSAIQTEGHSPTIGPQGFSEKRKESDMGRTEKDAVVRDSEEIVEDESKKLAYDHTHRKLKPRHIQLIGIGGTIGTVLYVQIGKALMEGGPASLFIAFIIWLVLIPSLCSLVFRCSLTVLQFPSCELSQKASFIGKFLEAEAQSTGTRFRPMVSVCKDVFQHQTPHALYVDSAVSAFPPCS